MRTHSIKRILKIVLIFSLIAICIDLGRKLIFTQFDLNRIFNYDFVLYDVLLEFCLLFLTGILTYFSTKKIKSTGLGASFIKIFVFSLIYCFTNMILSRIICLSIGLGFYYQFDLYKSFLYFLPNAFTKGILFMLIMVQLSPPFDKQD